MQIVIAFVFAIVGVLAFDSGEFYHVELKHDGSMHVEKGKGGVAWGIYNESRYITGWDELNIITNSSYDDVTQAKAAGFLEGALTVDVIYYAWLTFWNGTMNFTYPSNLQEFLSSNDEWVRSMASNPKGDVEYWEQVNLVVSQFEGMYEGYNKYASDDMVPFLTFLAHFPQQLTYGQFLLQEAAADIGDIQAALNLTELPQNPRSMMLNSHCSALVKITEDGQHLYVGQVQWTSFENMLRIFKHYNLNYQSNSTKSKTISFSSFPGYLPSGDDYYITDQNLVVLETTNDVMNNSLYEFVTPQTVLYWVRTIVANRMSSSGSEWSEIFAKYNSGTYNNQWMIVDYKLFKAGTFPLVPNTLWIAEQIPGHVESSDQTKILNAQLYWPSYNIPFYPYIYDVSGYPQCYKQFGNECSYEYAPRANIFRRDQHNVRNFGDMKYIMRYNKWQTDPFSLGDACNSISSRCDLDPPALQPTPFGGIDAKITDEKKVFSLTSEIIAGPTWESQPPFAWTDEWSAFPHYGQPDTFDFDFITVQPYQQ